MESWSIPPPCGRSVYCGLSMAHLDRLDLADASSWAERALGIGERLGVPSVIANACPPLGTILALTDVVRGKEVLERGWETSSVDGLGFQADLHRACGARIMGVALKDPEVGLHWINRGPDYSTTYSLFDIPAHLVAIHALKGEFDQATQTLEELQGRIRAIGQPTFGLWPDELAMLRLRKGDWDQAKAKLSQALDWAVGSENRWVEASTTQKLGEMYLAIGQEAQAERFLIRSLGLRRDSGSALGELALLPYLCEVYRRTERLEEADGVLARAHDIADNATESGALRGDLWLAEGLVSTSLGHWDAAEATLQNAVKMYQDYSLPWDEAKVYYEWAVAIKRGGDGGPRTERATELLDMALALWESMGAIHYAERCQQQFGQLRSRPL